jgi:hypothetical protein
MNMIRPAMALGLVALAALAGGCQSPPYTIDVGIDEKDSRLSQQSIEVNVIGVSAAELPTWEQMSMNSYWQPGSTLRPGQESHNETWRLMKFGEKDPRVQVVDKKDLIWRHWLGQRKVTHVVVLAYLPWITEDRPGDADQRRAILPLEGKRWKWAGWGDKKIPIKLLYRGLVVEKELKPE